MSFPLNRDQLKAAETLDGPLLINAGAGSGKTRTLTERLVRAVIPDAIRGWQPADIGEVAVITFTDKAAGELSERVRLSLRDAGRSDDARRVDTAWISTIHAFCARVLRRHALDAGIDPAFAVLTGSRAGMAREEAFERAAREVAQTPSGAALLELYSYSALYQAADRLRAKALSARLEPGQVSPEPIRSPQLVLAEATDYFRRTHAELQTCDLSGVSMAAHAEQCTATLSALLENGKATSAADIGLLVRQALGAYTQKRGVKSHAELCADIVETRERLAAEGAALETHDHAVTFIDLAERYQEHYGATKQAIGALDFDDLQSLTLQLFDESPDVADRFRKMFRLVMVDEFQDTDGLQLALVQAVGRDNLCTVGDERQSIYRFRGADLHVYRAHHEEMLRRGAQEISLGENYRSHQGLLVFVNRLFGAPSLFGPAGLIQLQAGRVEPTDPILKPDQPRVEIVLVDKTGRTEAPGRRAEAREIAKRFAGLTDTLAPSDMVILLRSYRHAAVYAEALQREGLPVLIVGGSRFFELPEVAYLRSLVRLVSNPHNDEALVLILDSPLAGLSPDGLWKLASHRAAQSHADSLWSVMPNTPGLSLADEAVVDRVYQVLCDARSRVGSVRLDEIVLRSVEELDYDRHLLGSGDGRQAYANVLKFARMAAEFDRSGGGGPAAFSAHLDASERLGEHESPAALSDDHSPAVRIMSIHASKGLEFPVVAVPELGRGVRGNDGIVRIRKQEQQLLIALSLPPGEGQKPIRSPLFASISETEKEEEVEELKRVLYVACTRARELLLLSGSSSLSKPAIQQTPIAWIRAAFGLDLTAEEGLVDVDLDYGHFVRVRAIHEEECDNTGAVVGKGAISERPSETSQPPEPKEGVGEAAQAERGAAEPRVNTGPQHVAYSDIAEYETCALRYRATRLWRLGSIGSEGETPSPLEFGSALHAVLQSVAIGLADEVDRVDCIARYYQLPEREKARLGAAVRAFTGSRIARTLRESERIVTEAPFSVELRDTKGCEFILTGSMDLIALSQNRALIVDYKTGALGTPQELAERYEAQARCYALAALKQGAVQVELHFVRPEVRGDDGEPQSVSFAYTASDVDALVSHVVGAYEKLASGVYEPLTQWDERACGECPIAGGVCSVSSAAGRSVV